MKRIFLFLLCLLVLSCTAAGKPESKQETIRSAVTSIPIAADTTTTFGTSVATVGESFVVPATDVVLSSFNLPVNLPADVVVHAYVFGWNKTTKVATGASLFDSGAITPTGAQQTLSFSPNLVLSSGQDIVVFVSCSVDYASVVSDGAVSTANDDTAYGAGHGYALANGASTGGWTSSAWTDLGADVSVSATFVGLPATTTTVSATPSGSTTFHQTATFTATVSPSSATGTVTFTDGANTLGSGSLSGGSTSINVSTLATGNHTIVATYAGDSGNAGSTSVGLPYTINPGPTSISVASSGSPSPEGASVTFTASLVSLPSQVPTGTVAFKDNGVTIGSGTVTGGVTATFSTTALALGSHPITAVYSGDDDWATSTSPVLTQQVNQDTATITGSITPEPSTFPNDVTAQVHVASSNSSLVPTGNVHFHEGATDFGTIALDGSGNASVPISGLSGGPHTIAADYSGNHGTVSASLGHTVNKATTTATVTSGTPSSVFGQSVTFTVNVTGAGGTPGGQVTFKDNGVDLGTRTLSGGSASLQTSALSVGSHPITVEYAGDNVSYAASTSSPITQAVARAATSATLTSSSTPAIVGNSITLTATITTTAPGVGIATGSVAFKEGGTTIGSATLDSFGVAALPIATLGVGTHTITAEYAQTASFEGSTSPPITQTINASGVSVSVTTSGSPSASGASVTFTATVSSTTGGVPTGTVTFLEGTTTLGTGTLAAGVGTFSIATLAAGTHTITARYEGDGTHVAGATATVTQNVNTAVTTTALASSVNPAAFGQEISLTATVTSAASGTRTGNVTFKDGGATLGAVVLGPGGTCTFKSSSLAVGTHSLTATYEGDPSFGASNSNTVSQVVDRAATSIELVSSSSPSLLGSSVTFTATVTATAPGGGVPTGAVVFREGATQLGSGTLSGSGVATFATTALAAGSHSITADYAQTTSYAASTATITQAVNTKAATISLAAAPNPSAFGASVTFTANISGTSGTPSGTVVFKDGATALGDAVTIDASGAASLTTNKLNAGARTITAFYSGDGTYATGTGSVSHVVDKASTTCEVTSSSNPAAPGAPITFTATVSSSTFGFTGRVRFYDGSVQLSESDLNSAVASATTGVLTTGGHTITIQYDGTANFAACTSPGLNQVVEVPNRGGPGNGDGGLGGALGDAAGNPNASVEGDGCSCRPTRTTWPGTAPLVVLAAGVAAFARRRRR